MITEDYISFETAKLLKENKFNEFCWYVYLPIDMFCMGTRVETNVLTEGQRRLIDNDGIDAMSIEYNWHPRFQGDYYAIVCPTLQMAMKWLREVHNLFIEPTAGENDGKDWYDFDVIPVNGRNIKWDHYENIPTDEYSSPEEACEAGIRYCLENLI